MARPEPGNGGFRGPDLKQRASGWLAYLWGAEWVRSEGKAQKLAGLCGKGKIYREGQGRRGQLVVQFVDSPDYSKFPLRVHLNQFELAEYHLC